MLALYVKPHFSGINAWVDYKMFRKIVLIFVISFITNVSATVNTLNNATARSPKAFSGTRLDMYKLQGRRLTIEKFKFTAP